MGKEIRVGVVGCGYWGPNLIRNFRGLDDCRVTRMCDLNESRLFHLGRLYPEVEGVDDFQRLLEDPEIDAVAVATPVSQHYPMAKASLMAGKHTLIEKPMALNSDHCEELIELAQEKGLVLMVGHTFLYSAPVKRIKELIERRDIGDIQDISARRLNLGLFQKDINVAWDLAPHDISIILHIMDQLPLSVNCQGNAHITEGVEDVTNMSLNFAKGRFATIQNSWIDPRKVREMTFVGTKRMIVYNDVEPLEKLKIYDSRVERPPHYDSFSEFQYAYHYGDRYLPHIDLEEPLKAECQHFIDCISRGETPLSDGIEGLRVVKVLEAASVSLGRHGVATSLLPQEVSTNGNNAIVKAARDSIQVRVGTAQKR